ncbi:hypothetical protein [Oleiharenicola lentus]|uniref:hypothetical protein n=1 Tax=Oleiharenicola lentus TaxID=2508720 RepID=UPI003F6787D4
MSSSRKKILVVAVVGLLVLGGGFGYWHQQKTQRDAAWRAQQLTEDVLLKDASAKSLAELNRWLTEERFR